MTKKKMYGALMVGIICFILCAIPTIASADVDVSVAGIYKIGIRSDLGPTVQLIDVNGQRWEAGTYRQFYLSEAMGNKGLATLLTALSMEKTVWVRIAGDGSSGSLIKIIYINN